MVSAISPATFFTPQTTPSGRGNALSPDRANQSTGGRGVQHSKVAGRSNPDGPDSTEATGQGSPGQIAPAGLTAEEQAVVAELSQTDRQVRAHEQAHLAAAGGLARGVSFTYVTGPDGQRYAVGGEVSIDTSPVGGDPEATILKAQQIRAAANAPANPSSQDRQVAAQAGQMEQAARVELAQQEREKLEQRTQSSQARSFDPQDPARIGTILSLLA